MSPGMRKRPPAAVILDHSGRRRHGENAAPGRPRRRRRHGRRHAPHAGFGLLGMRERVLSLGGSLQISSPHGCGTRVRVNSEPDTPEQQDHDRFPSTLNLLPRRANGR
jgi:hypothetical protein